MEVIPNQRLVFTWPNGESGSTSLVTVEFQNMASHTHRAAPFAHY